MARYKNSVYEADREKYKNFAKRFKPITISIENQPRYYLIIKKNYLWFEIRTETSRSNFWQVDKAFSAN